MKETEIEDEDSAYCWTLEINKEIKEEIDILSFLSDVDYLRILILKTIKKTKSWKVCKGWDMLEKTDK